jgi:hypothetical protein
MPNTHPLSLHLSSHTKLQCTLQLSGQVHSPYFISTNICALWFYPRILGNNKIIQVVALQTVFYPRLQDNINIEQLMALQTVFCSRLHDNINIEQVVGLQTLFCPQNTTRGGALHSG